jgi:hypothetical protein
MFAVLRGNLKDSTVDLLCAIRKLKKLSDSNAVVHFYYSRVLIQGKEKAVTAARE